MRAGFALGSGGTDISNCKALGNEFGFHIGSNSRIRNSSGDAKHGPLLYLTGNDSTVELELLPNESEVKIHTLANIAGRNNTVSITSTDGERSRPLPIKLGYSRPGSSKAMVPYVQPRAENVSLRNATSMPVIIGQTSKDCDIQTKGEVWANAGSNINISRLDDSVPAKDKVLDATALKRGGERKWSFDADGWVHSSAALGADGSIYFGSAGNTLYALRPDGTQKWSFNEKGMVPLHSSPAVSKDGETVYVGTDVGTLYAIVAEEGTELWRRKIGTWISSTPAIAEDGTIYAGSSDHQLYAFSRDGEQKWTFKTSGPVQSTVAFGNDGTLYAGSDDGRLYALHPEGGTEKWTFEADSAIRTHPAVAENGTIYVSSIGGNVYALDPDKGTEQWVFKIGNWIQSSPAIGDGGTIFVGSFDTRLYAINPDGTKKWAFPTQRAVKASPAVGKDGTVYLAGFNGYLYAIDSDEGTGKWEHSIGRWPKSTPVIDEDGTIYIGTRDGLLAIEPYHGLVALRLR